MSPSEILHRVGIVRTDVSEERSNSIVTYTRYVCAVVSLITRRGFGLDTGFIHYGDL
jgi:hypothetical protein